MYVPLLENIIDFAGDNKRLGGITRNCLAEVEEVLGHPLRAAELANQSADLLATESGMLRLNSFYARNLASRSLTDAGRYEDAVAGFTKLLPMLEREVRRPSSAGRLRAEDPLVRTRARLAIPRSPPVGPSRRSDRGRGLQAGPRRRERLREESDRLAFLLEGNPRAAIDRFTPAIALRTKAFGPDAVLVGMDLSNIAAAPSRWPGISPRRTARPRVP